MIDSLERFPLFHDYRLYDETDRRITRREKSKFLSNRLIDEQFPYISSKSIVPLPKNQKMMY